MTLHYHQTRVTPAEHTALSVAIQTMHHQVAGRRAQTLEDRTELSHADHYLLQSCETALLWLAQVSEELYEEWEALPEGSHLREAYADQVWTWSDRDLAAMPPTTGWDVPSRPTTQED